MHNYKAGYWDMANAQESLQTAVGGEEVRFCVESHHFKSSLIKVDWYGIYFMIIRLCYGDRRTITNPLAAHPRIVGI